MRINAVAQATGGATDARSGAVRSRLLGRSGPLAVVLAISIATWAFVVNGYPLFGDALQYYDFATLIVSVGPWAFASDYRTYGYPAMLAAIVRVVGRDVDTVRTATFVVQLSLLIGVAWIGARRVDSALGVNGVGPVTFAVTVVNPFLLVFTTEVLTDLPSAALLYLAVVLALPRRRPEPRGRVAVLAICALFCAGFTVMLRPSNLLAALAVVAVWGARAIFSRDLHWLAIPAALLAFCLPFVPQAWSNARAFGVASPLVVSSIYGDNARWGLMYLKSATLVLPGVTNTLYYDNPFRPPPDLTVTEAIRDHPVAYLATLALHAFALVDQDFLFAYIRDVDPWYRWPLSVANYAFFLAALVGFAIGLRGSGDRSSDLVRRQRFVLLAFGLTALALVSFYLPIKVESRYGLPLFLLLAPACALAAVTVYERALSAGPSRLALGALAVAAWVGAAASVSVWFQHQAPLLVALREARTDPQAAVVPPNPGQAPLAAVGGSAPAQHSAAGAAPAVPTPEIPSALYAADLPREMAVSTGTVVDVTVTNTGRETWNVRAPYLVNVAARFTAQSTELHRRVQGMMKDSQAVELPYDVPPGGSATVRLRILAPPVPGRYTLMVHVTRIGVPDSPTHTSRVVRVENGW